MLLFLVSFCAAAAMALIIVRSSRRHGRFSGDHDLSGPQKFHARPVPRVGGLAVVLGLACAFVVDDSNWLRQRSFDAMALTLLACGLPALLMGFAEDLTKRVRPLWRLLAAAVSGALGVWALDATIARTDLWGLDALAASSVGAALLAVFVVAGIANAVNIIDGFNGLASMCVMLMLLAIAYVAYEVGDHSIVLLGLVGVGATLGFFIWNFPAGLIFLGDGGAYFLGFYVAELGILLISRNPRVSPLFPLLLSIYPVFETLFSMYRRRVLKGRAVGMPDGVHLHSLVYRRLLRWAVGREDAKALTQRSSMTAPYLWLLCMMSVVPAVVFWDNSRVLGCFIVLFGVTYVVLYARIVRFKTPRALIVRR
ncbi:MraY family glycosyltransferase [Caldimonas sp. KR1-144]|uniref:MraY family glycosyltransferase n=1 Tax=Caldimonas sp. KR1-144 TaxID=3400911 RepID=UPI003C09C789